MAKVVPSATFQIVGSRRLGLDRCEFDVKLVSDRIRVHDLFQVVERGSLWDWVVLKAQENDGVITLHCLNWVPESGAFIGETCLSRPMRAAERKRYAKYLVPE